MNVLPSASVPADNLKQGDRAPHFELVDPITGILRSRDLLRSGPLVLTFYRGAWCGCCQADLRELGGAMRLFKTRNATVIGVFHDLSAEANSRIRATYNIKFPLVNDADGRTAEAFGVRRSEADMAEIENEFGPELLVLREGQPWITPMQARYVIGRDEIIAYSEITADYNGRSGVEAFADVLGRL